jgi:hypothetical protein
LIFNFFDARNHTRHTKGVKKVQEFVNKKLRCAAHEVDYQGVIDALDLGADGNAIENERGDTALHEVTSTTKLVIDDTRMEGATKITELLMNSGGAKIVKNKKNETPIDIAYIFPDSPILKIYKAHATPRSSIGRCLKMVTKSFEKEDLLEKAEEAYPEEGFQALLKERECKKQRNR